MQTVATSNQQSNGHIPATSAPRKAFNPNRHIVQIKTKDGPKPYLPIEYRITWFRLACPHGTILTELITHEPDKEVSAPYQKKNEQTGKYETLTRRATGYCVFKATISDGDGGAATGYESGNGAAFPNYLEKAETGAIGRALAALGYGTASAPEYAEPRVGTPRA